MKGLAGERIRGSALRWNASAKLRAVTGAPVSKRNVRFSSKVYVRPPFEMLSLRTTSGTTRGLPVSGSSTVVKSFAQVALSSAHDPM